MRLVQRGVQHRPFKAQFLGQLESVPLTGLAGPAQAYGGASVVGLHGLCRQGRGLLHQLEGLRRRKRSLVNRAPSQFAHAGSPPEIVADWHGRHRQGAGVQAVFIDQGVGEICSVRDLDAVPAGARHLGAKQLAARAGDDAARCGLLVQRRHGLRFDGQRLGCRHARDTRCVDRAH